MQHKPIWMGLLMAWVAVGLLDVSGSDDMLDQAVLTWGFRLRPAPEPDPRVSVVVLRGQASPSDPPPVREPLAELLEHLVQSGSRPGAVLLDVLLTERESDRSCGDEAQQTAGERVVAASQRLGTVVQGLALVQDPRERFTAHPMLEPVLPQLMADVEGYPQPFASDRWLLAHPSVAGALYSGAAAVGNVGVTLPRGTGRTLSTLPLLSRALLRAPEITQVVDDQTSRDQASPPGPNLEQAESEAETALVPSLALAGAALIRCANEHPPGTSAQVRLSGCLVPSEHGLRLNEKTIPQDEQGQLLLNLRKRFQLAPEPPLDAMPERGLEVLSFRDSSQGTPGLVLPRSGKPVGPQALEGRALVVLDARERSSLVTPLGDAFPPATLHAQALSMLLQDDFLLPVPPVVEGLLVLGSVLLAVWAKARGIQGRLPSGMWHFLGRELHPSHSILKMRLEAALRTLGLLTALGVEAWLMKPEFGLLLLWGVGAGVGLTLGGAWLPVAHAGAALAGCGLGGWLGRLEHPDAVRKQQDALEEQFLRATQEVKALAERIEGLEQDVRSEAEAEEQATQEIQTVIDDATRQVPQGDHERPLTPAGAALVEQLQQARKVYEARVQVQEVQLDALEQWRYRQGRRQAQVQELIHMLRRTMGMALPSLREPAPNEREDDTALEPPPHWNVWEEHSLEELRKLANGLGLVATSPVYLREVVAKIVGECVRGHLVPVMLVGETGTGKNEVHRAIHKARDKKGRCTEFNCSVMSDEPSRAMLYGWVPGAFTGALKDTPGHFEESNSGSLLLDQAESFPLEEQAKLLRVINQQPCRFSRLGETRDRTAHVTIVSAFNEEPEDLIGAGRLRDDLLNRLRGITIRIPPLRERPEDIPALAEHFLRKAQEALVGVPERRLSPGALQCLCRHTWPGNARDLLHVMERLANVPAHASELIEAPEVYSAIHEGYKRPGQASEVLSPKTVLKNSTVQGYLEGLRAVNFDLSMYLKSRHEGDKPLSRQRADAQLRIVLLHALLRCEGSAKSTVAWLTEERMLEEVNGSLQNRLSLLIKKAREVADARRGGPAAPELKVIERGLKSDYGGYMESFDALVTLAERGMLLDAAVPPPSQQKKTKKTRSSTVLRPQDTGQ